MSDAMDETTRTMEVEPAEEGPKVKAKRVLTEAQLEALKRGRNKLAEKRKMASTAATAPEEITTATAPEEPTAEVKKEVAPDEPEIGWASASVSYTTKEVQQSETNEESYQLCSVM